MLDIIFSIASEKIEDTFIEECVVSQELICAVLPNDHPLASKKKVSRRDFQGEKFIFLKPEDGSGTFEAMMEDCRKANFTPQITNFTSNVETVLMLVESGVGISFLPKCCQNPSDSVVFVELAEENTSSLVLRWRKDSNNPTIPLFLDVIKNKT